MNSSGVGPVNLLWAGEEDKASDIKKDLEENAPGKKHKDHEPVIKKEMPEDKFEYDMDLDIDPEDERC